MTTTITHSDGSIVPTIVDGYEATRQARTIVHVVLDREEPDITFRAAGLRTGTLTCVFAVQAEALEAYGILSIPQILTLSDDDVAAVGMDFVVADGDIGIALDDETRNVWIVTVPFVEVGT